MIYKFCQKLHGILTVSGWGLRNVRDTVAHYGVIHAHVARRHRRESRLRVLQRGPEIQGQCGMLDGPLRRKSSR
jgi:hypothetical protein